MRTSIRARLAAAGAVVGLLLSSAAPAVAPVAAADHLILRAGTDQDLQVLNPFSSILVVDFEVFTLNYDLLVNFGADLEPVPGFADSWEVSADGLTWTFHIREGMKWSDGTPATSEDALYTFQLILDATEKSNASEDGFYLGAGYLEGYHTNAGVIGATAPDPQTLVVETEFASQLLLQAYVPILPKHVWSSYTLEEIGSAEGAEPFLNEPPIVGTGPYQVVEWKPGEFIRYARNPEYWGENGAADEVILLTFESADTMVQALKTGDVDYVRGIQPEQFEALQSEPDIQVVEGISNGYSQIAFNTYSRGPIEGGGASTTALQDPAFRDALAWAIDQAKLVEVTLGGHGAPGDTNVPPYHTLWHVSPDKPRTFDLEEAKRRLDAAGYTLNAEGKRLDKEGKPIVLRVTWPDSEAENATNAQFIQEWWSQIGVGVDAFVTEEGKLLEDLLPPEGGGVANFDIELWGWVGDADPTSLLNVLRSEEIGSFSDSFWENDRYDELFLLQRAEGDATKRFEYIKEMQNVFYDEAPYIILYYDAELHAYRTDKFSNWSLQPSKGGTPLFGYGSIGYTKLTDANAVPTPGPTSAGGPTAAPTPAPSGDGAPSGGGDQTTTLLVVGAAVVGVVAFLLLRRRRSATEEE
ncbi:MAG: bac 5 protein [Chloroflexi bacterium]|nr:bac 5 protein [Chloroflexota bacterium]